MSIADALAGAGAKPAGKRPYFLDREVERVLAEHPAVMEVAIIGVPDDQWGEAVKAVVSLHPGTTATPEELIAYCREHLAHYKCPKSVDILELLPRNPTGKILKRELRAPYWADRDRAV